MLENLKKYKIILASQSARRQELLKGLDIEFEIKTINGLKETYPTDLQIDKVPEYLAKQKADYYMQFLEEDTLLITADTIVVADNQLLGKPKNEQEAKNMLQTLSGATHKVITGICLTTQKKQKIFSTVTKVTFSVLNNNEINYYVKKYQPYDKAGGYGIQEWIGFTGVEKIEGSYYNVMGLPVQKIYQILKKFE
ncbi:MAG: Maf family nucleotide pyrophosphatase [Prevotellaceae bacterium]|jgi:septum formation protein|nr:Maf family nucleotide pyrophosphatase [Prevotellaceae bacterium]